MNSQQLLRNGLLLFVFVSPSAMACVCRTESLTERIERSQIVLVAVVTDFKPLDHVTLWSKEVFKGYPGATIRIPTGVSDCDYFLPPISPRIGESFLLFVGQSGRRLYASRCQNSGSVAERMADVVELRKRNKSIHTSKDPANIVR